MSWRVFLYHSSADKEQVRDLHQRLRRDGVLPWLDEEDILPGQDWDGENRRAIRESCLPGLQRLRRLAPTRRHRTTLTRD